jgi:tetratricopeptide (TPR) repeat protein
VREDLYRATRVYRKALDIAPMDVDMRKRLIALLIKARQYDQAIEQYISMADTYYQLAQIDQSIEQYNQALRFAPQGDPARHWEVNILHRIGDIYMQRVNWREAIKIYQRAKRIEPQDDKVRMFLVDLYFKTAQRAQALKEVDDLIAFFMEERMANKLVTTMKAITGMYPQEIAVHMRMAKIYLDIRKKRDAIAELDVVGELQLNEGKTADAIRTIQAIIRLGPDDVEQYKRLLVQIKK